MRAVLLIVASLCCHIAFADEQSAAPASGAAAQKPHAKPAKSPKPVVDLRAAHKEFLAKVKRGEVSFGFNDQIPMATRFKAVDRDAVFGWIHSIDVGAEGLLPSFEVKVCQVIDGENFITDIDEAEPIWFSGWDTSKWTDGQYVQLPDSQVKVGTHRYETAVGSKTVRGVELQPEPTEEPKPKQPKKH